MGIVWRNGDLNDLTTHAALYVKEIERQAEKVVDETAREGAEVMRGYIESRGTGWRGHRGRVDEGYMLGDVAHNVTKSADGVRGKWGWGTTGGPKHPYYRFQEQGFTIWNSGHTVPPMHALLDSFIKVREEFARKIRKML